MSMTIFEAIKESIAFIESSLTRDIGVLDVANAVSYSQFYFSREFTRHTHISVYDYILRRKISESYKCLFEKNSKIVDLAFQFGFQSHEVYTRAFRKMFGENPSEAAVYKPLALFEHIDEAYLTFLHGLKIEIINKPDSNLCFKIDSSSQSFSEASALALLGNDNLYLLKIIFHGRADTYTNSSLSFELKSLKTKLRIFHNNMALSFRYFIDNYYDSNEMSSNYIFIKKEPEYIDILIPGKAEQ